ncbi:MAG: YfiR family protein [Novosphingobium sp.]|nr:YfiR family protein [Novosphingobium sp.]MBO9601541.1 YfiR family protein [Novosphingobium sp.]
MAGATVSLALAAALPLASASADPAAPDAQVKAGYLYKLAAFVRWPGPGPELFRICVSGRADIAAALTGLAHDRLAGGHRIAVAQLDRLRAQDAAHCQILFLGGGDGAAEGEMLDAVVGMPVLTVADRDAGASGGVIEFFDRDGKLRLAVDRAAASAHRLELSSKLVDAAVQVKP